MRRTLTITGLILAVTFTIVACGPTSSSSSSSGKSVAACGHWANIRGDVSAGILTTSELRTKIAEVRSSASTPAVESAATQLLAGITSGSKSEITNGVKVLNSACS
jgi:hypothetical protein